MNSYDDIGRFKEKADQPQLDYQTFSDKDVRFNSPWKLLNELARYQPQFERTVTSQPITAKTTPPPQAPVQSQPQPIAEPQGTALRSLLKKVSQ